MKRLTRTQQNERNRALVLDAARSVFLARGYHGATVDEIAEQAGFSRGVVYSRFGTKADLFLALLDQRIDGRAEQNAAVARGLSGERGLDVMGALAELVAESRQERGEREWGLLLIEFRVHAARDPELNRRYAAAHERTIERLAAVLAGAYERAGQDLPFPGRQMAEAILALDRGTLLEQAARPEALPAPVMVALLGRIFAEPAAAGSAESR